MHILNGKQFADPELLNKIFAKADELAIANATTGMAKVLTGKVIATIFFEPSTRTRLSFESASLKLGAGVISVENAKTSSSGVKGESIEDTMRMINCYADAVVIRHPVEGSVERASKVAEIPVINGGDGGNEHPSQALYDLYTIKKDLGRLDNLKIVFGFDPYHSRTIKSLSKLLAIFPNNKFIFVSPKSLAPKPELVHEIMSMGISVELQENLNSIGEADVIYVNRLQEERFENRQDFETNRKLFTLKKEHLIESKSIILNPLPRIDEIEIAVDDMPNARYFQQAKNGLYIRAALLLYSLGLM